MFARIITTQVSPGKITELIQLWNDSVAPALKVQKGFKSTRVLIDRKTGKIVTIALWETETDMQATSESSAFLQAQLAKFASLFTAPPVVEQYEVGAEQGSA